MCDDIYVICICCVEAFLLLMRVRRFRKISKSDYYRRHVFLFIRQSVRMQQLSYHSTDFYEILIFEYFSKICRENLSLIRTGQE